MDPKEERRKRIIVQSVAGAGSSIANHLLHPLDMIKVRFQSHDSGKNENNAIKKYRSFLDSFKTIKKEEGFRGFYKGVFIAFTASGFSYGIFFGLYEKMLQKVSPHFEHDLSRNVVASFMAGAVSSFLFQPLFVIKTRRLLDYSQGTGFERMKNLVSQLYNQHGIAGFYRGYFLSLLLCMYGVFQISTYKYLKGRLDANFGENKTPNGYILGAGGISRLLASGLLHPLTTVRTRLQQNQFMESNPEALKYQGVGDIVKKTYAGEGLRGFYKGIVPLTVRTLPSHALFFLVYENLKNGMSKKMGLKSIK